MTNKITNIYPKLILILLVVILMSVTIFAQDKSGNNKILEKLFAKAKSENWQKLKQEERIPLIAKSFLGIKYTAGTLENPEKEICLVNLEGLDCFTFVEAVININRLIIDKRYNSDSLYDYVQQTRYRTGADLNNLKYTDRLHYTSEWLLQNGTSQNEKNSLFKDISKELGGEKFKFNLGFMSQNPKFYPALVKYPEYVPVIEKTEKYLNSKEFYYIPKDKVKSIESKLKSGDIILIATSKKGLDYSHLGFAYRETDGTMRLLHASTKQKEVIIDKTISEYLANNSSAIGISVLRME